MSECIEPLSFLRPTKRLCLWKKSISGPLNSISERELNVPEEELPTDCATMSSRQRAGQAVRPLGNVSLHPATQPVPPAVHPS